MAARNLPGDQEGMARPAPVFRWRADGGFARDDDMLSHEEPLEIRVRGRPISVTMRTPGHDADLAAGFLFTEGVITAPSDILSVHECPRNEAGNTLDIQLAADVHVDFARLTRHVFASSSCGLCGKATINAVLRRVPKIAASLQVDPAMLATLPAIMRRAQQTFDQTGGLHAAALFSAEGKLLVLREDVGRHNAVDKVLGHALMSGWLPLGRHILLVSGRASFEIVQKSLVAGIPVLAAVSAPSTLAATLASECGQTLIGFLRDTPARLNVYSHAQRLGVRP